MPRVPNFKVGTLGTLPVKIAELPGMLEPDKLIRSTREKVDARNDFGDAQNNFWTQKMVLGMFEMILVMGKMILGMPKMIFGRRKCFSGCAERFRE